MDPLYSIKEAALALGGISPWTVYAWTSKGKLRKVKIGSRTMIAESELRRFIKEGQIESKNEIHAGSDFADRICRIERKDELVVRNARQEAEARRKQMLMELMHGDV